MLLIGEYILKNNRFTMYILKGKEVILNKQGEQNGAKLEPHAHPVKFKFLTL